MLSKKGLVGAAIGVALVGTRAGREQVARLAGLVKQRVGPGGGDPFAVAPSEGHVAAAQATTADQLPEEARQDLAADLPPTPGTVAVAVGAPNAPDLDVISGDQNAEHREAD